MVDPSQNAPGFRSVRIRQVGKYFDFTPLKGKVTFGPPEEDATRKRDRKPRHGKRPKRG